MSLVQTFLESNGYDYYGNAAEDTLLFFVHDENAPMAEEPDGRNNETITNISGDTANRALGDLSSDTSISSPDSNVENDNLANSVPKMTKTDLKQTSTKHSIDKKFEA